MGRVHYITLDFQDVPAEEIADKLLTQVAGRTAPDVAYLDQSSDSRSRAGCDAAARAGKHLFVEKPMCMTIDEGRAISAPAEARA
jgi:ABC-type glycerol-3-phosphate transport system substrate-binding protein